MDDETRAVQGFKSAGKDLSDAKRMGARESTQAGFRESKWAISFNTCMSLLYKLSYKSSVIVGATVSHQEDITGVCEPTGIEAKHTSISKKNGYYEIRKTC